MAATIIKPEKEQRRVLKTYQHFKLKKVPATKALITAIFPSTDLAVISYNLKGPSTEHTDDDYESIGEGSDAEELDSIEIAQICETWPS